MEQAVYKQNQTQIFIETPFRNRKLFEALLDFCMKHTKLCIASDLTLGSEKVATHTIADWKKETANIHKKPAVFLLYR
jgi:16S rRNA (cytidine1402-2'-O)-methyltransferase